MSQDQIIAAITSALQTADSNGEYANVVLLIQAQLINWLPNASSQQLQTICQILNINTSGGGS